MRQSVRGLSSAVSVLLLAGVVAALPAAGQEEESSDEVEVDAAVQVTADADPARGHVMPAVAVNPQDERVLAIAEGDAVGGPCAVHVSDDYGLSWRQVSQPEIPARWVRCTFTNLGTVADVAFGPDGTLYYGFNGFDPETSEGQVFLARSDDLGETWETTGLPRVERDLDEGEMGLDALPSIAIDPNDADRVHVAWMSNWGTWRLRGEVLQGQEYFWDIVMRPYVATSTDGGASFTEPVNLLAEDEDLWLAPDLEGGKTPPRALVGNDGAVYVVFGEETRAGPREDPQGDAPSASLYLAVSRDGGATYEGANIYTEPTPVEREAAFLWAPRGAIDRNTGNLYVVWEQVSNAQQPVSILMMRSTDGGDTWSEPTAVNDVEPPRKFTYMEFFPEVSVAPNGRVDIAWYDARNDPTVEPDPEMGGNTFHDVYYTYSDDEGDSWAPNVRITDRLIDRRIGPFATGDIQGTLGLASTDEGAYIAWDDSRNGSEQAPSQDIYFARARQAQPESFFSAATVGAANDRMLAGVLGAALALLLGGLLLFVAARTKGRGSAPKRTEATA